VQKNILAARSSKPRCQLCASENTTHVEFGDNNNLAHGFKHGCGGMLKTLPDDCDISFSLIPMARLVTTEGVFIEEREYEDG